MADTVWQDQVSGWTNLAAVRGYRSRLRETKLKVALSALVLALKLALSALVLTFHLMVMKRTETVKTAEVVDATRPCCLQQVREWPGTCWPYNWRRFLTAGGLDLRHAIHTAGREQPFALGRSCD